MQYRCDIGQKGLKRWPDYLTAVIQNLINWDFVNANLG